jgi:hypothetical protein
MQKETIAKVESLKGESAIGRVLKFSTVAILKWIRSFGVQDFRRNAPAKIVALDEMHTYIGSKKILLDRESCHRAKTLKRHQRMRNKKRDDGLLEAVYRIYSSRATHSI